MTSAATEAVRCHTYLPAGREDVPVLVLVHGAGRRALTQLRRFVPAAAARGRVLLAPELPADRFSRFQRLEGAAGPLAGAHALRQAVAETASRAGAATDVFDVFGFSGGAQFAHRYAMLFPEHVRRVVVAAAGWYTWLDAARPYPHGVGAAASSAGATVDVEAFLRIPIRVLVGEEDVGRDRLLRATARLDREQGENRVERAQRWVQHLRAEAAARGLEARASLEILPGVGHSFTEAAAHGRLAERTLAFLDGGDRRPAALVPVRQ